VVLELAAELGIPAREVGMIAHDLATADEVFLTGTGAELIPVVSFDEQPVGNGKPGPVFRRLLESFRSRTRSEGEPYLVPAESSLSD
jgi:branched-chain amino acid aminotransferase